MRFLDIAVYSLKPIKQAHLPVCLQTLVHVKPHVHKRNAMQVSMSHRLHQLGAVLAHTWYELIGKLAYYIWSLQMTTMLSC